MSTCRNDSDCASREYCKFEELDDIQGVFGTCAIPEPSTVLLLTVGLVVVALATFLKRKLGGKDEVFTDSSGVV